MAFDGNGNFNRVHNWTSDAANGVDINAVEMDAEDAGFAAGLSNCVTRDGQGKMTVDFLPYADNVLNVGTSVLRWATLNGVSIANFANPTQASLGALLYPITAAEAAASVTPAFYYYPPYDIRRYGADPSATDNTTAINNAFAAAAKTSGVTVYGAPGIFNVAGPLSIDFNTTGFDGRGMKILAHTLTTGAWLTPKQGNADVNSRACLNIAHPFCNCTIQGPGTQYTAAVAFYLNDPTNVTVCSVAIHNVGFLDWANDIYFENGSFCTEVTQCTFGVTTFSTGVQTTNSVTNPAGTTNSGERQHFSGCFWYNKAYHIFQYNGNSDMFFEGCSFDGHYRSFNVGGGNCWLSNCHMESAQDVDYWIYTNGGSFIATNIEFVVDANKSAYPIAYSNYVAGSNYPLIMDKVFLGTGTYTFTTEICDGFGPNQISNVIMGYSGARPVVSRYQNTLAYGGFEIPAGGSATTWANDWALTGTTPPARSTAQAHSGSASCLLTATSTNTPQMVHTTVCSPGQYLTGELYYTLQNLTGTGGTFFVSISFLDKSGAAIPGFGATELSLTSSVGVWTRLGFSFASPAPSGTHSASLTINVFGTTTGTSYCYVDDIIINVT